MKKVSMMKKAISVFLSVCMIVSVFAMGMTVSAADGETGTEATAATEVYYSGQKLNSETPYLLIGKAPGAAKTTLKPSAQAADSDGSWSVLAQFDADTGTFTFKSGNDVTTNSWALGFPLVKIDTNNDENTADEKYYGIYANGSLTIELGDNVNLLYFSVNSRYSPTDAAQEGIHVEGDLTVNGGKKGLLRVSANPAGKENGGLQSYGINVSGTVTLNGGILDAYETVWANSGAGYKLSTNKTTFIKANNVKLNGGALYLRGRALANPSGYKDNFKLHEIGINNTDAITVPDSYSQNWDNYLELTSGTSNDDNNNKDKGNDINDGSDFKSTREENMLYVKYTLADEKGFKIKVAGKELGGYEKYLHIGSDNTGVTANEDSTDAAAEYNITKNSDGTLTKELKFLKDTKIGYSVASSDGNAKYYVIESDSDLIVNTNGKTVSLTGTAADWNGWNITRGACVRADGNVTINGGGTLNANLGAKFAAESSESDKSVTSVIYSGNKITIDDITATFRLEDERSSGGTTTPQSNILYAPQVEFTVNADVKMAKNQAPGGTTPGYIIGGADAADKIIIPVTADTFVGNSKSEWGQPIKKASDKLYDYFYDKMKTSTYMEVSTADTTVAISSVSVNDGETVSDAANTVKFIPTAADAAEGSQIFVLAKACDENGVLTSAAIYSGAADGKEHILTLDGGESVKLYVWNAADGLKPLKKVRTYYAAETAAE